MTPTTEPLIRNIAATMLMDAPDNPNRMSEGEYRALKRFMEQEGFLGTVLVKPLEMKLENGKKLPGPAAAILGGNVYYRIIDGHHRVRAARELKMTEIPCVVVERDDQREVLMRIAMNKLRGELDLTGVGRAFNELSAGGLDLTSLEITGYSGSEINDLLAAVTQDVDEALPSDMKLPAEDDYDPDVGSDKNVFELKLLFASKDDLKKARAGLRRAAGKTKDMALGLLRLLGEEKEKPDAKN